MDLEGDFLGIPSIHIPHLNGNDGESSESIYLSILKFCLSVILPFAINAHAKLLQAEDFSNNFNSLITVSPSTETFDYIIVGGGSAGAVVANRLSAPPNNFQVLLLEAGGDPNFVTFFPGFDVFAPNHPDVDWMFRSVEADKYCLSCDSKSAAVTRGKGLGGSSNLNFMIYNRGNAKGFDDWAKTTGDQNWSYKNVLKYFKKSENYAGNYPDPAIHGCGGEMFINGLPYAPGIKHFERALKEHGIHEQDLNANQTNAFMKLDQTTRDGIRWGSYNAFLQPILKRPNLWIYRYSFVTRLIFDRVDPTRVIGVQYMRQNLTFPRYALARGEVILSAGAFGSPKILLQSGIGPREHLEELNINVVSDLPVGKNYEDHPTTLFPIIFDGVGESSLYERDLVSAVNKSYAQGGFAGPLAGTGVLATGYISSPYNDDVTWPDVQSYISYDGMSVFSAEVFGPLLNIAPERFNNYMEKWKGIDGNLVLVTLVRPSSVGWVKLNGTDPYTPPLINPNFFSDAQGTDIRRMVHGFKFMVDFYEKSKSYSKINARLLPAPWPACANFKFKSDKYYECYIRHITFTLWHPAGTCKMGKVNDPNTVVDSRLRVLGIKGLRVIDNSIMPRITNGNTNAPAVMIGELGSEMIIEDWGGVNDPAGSQAPWPCGNDEKSPR